MNIEVLPETEDRLAVATYLLLNAHYSLEDIRVELGFESLVEFDRAFQVHSGNSLEAYRCRSLPIADQVEWLSEFQTVSDNIETVAT
jgi:hypothetical protein